jgi:hypothetical protein
MKIAQRIVSAAFVAMLAACGGSSGNAALSRSFTYGSAQPPSAAESSAAKSAQTNLSAAATFSSAPDKDKGLAIFEFATVLADGALGTGSFGVAPPRGDDITRGLRGAAQVSSACTTVTATSVTYNNCSITEGGYTITMNGNITVSASSVTWSITAGFSGVSSGYTTNLSFHYAGTMSVTASKITGNGVFDVSGSVSGNGQTTNFGVATAAVVDLTYQSAPSFCVTAGSVEVKRVWTAKPAGATGPEFKDTAVKIVWTGCDTLTVAHSN